MCRGVEGIVTHTKQRSGWNDILCSRRTRLVGWLALALVGGSSLCSTLGLGGVGGLGFARASRSSGSWSCVTVVVLLLFIRRCSASVLVVLLTVTITVDYSTACRAAFSGST
jgi:hypothetical protein